MNFNTKGFHITIKFILLLCVGFFLVGGISSCRKGVSSKGFAGIIQAGVIPTNDSDIDPLAKDVFSYYTAGATLITKYLSPTGTGDGSSWSNAQGNLQKLLDGIKDASSNKIYLILLATGEYKAGVGINMKNNIAIVGGFTAKDDADYTQSTTDTTTLSGDKKYGVFSNKGLDNSALLYGVKITAGQTEDTGGGMFNDNSSPTISYVTFAANTAAGSGGGVCNKNNSSPILNYVTFAANNSDFGGGMFNDNSSPTISYVTFAANTAAGSGGGVCNKNNSSPILNYVTFAANNSDFGGGMFNDNSSPILTHVTFSGNTADVSGGGMFNDNYSSPILNHVTFAGNTAVYGGGMFNDDNSSPILNHVTFAGNTAESNGGGIYNLSSSSILIASSILWGNTVNGSAQQIYNQGGNISLYNSVLQGGKNNITGTGTTYYNVNSMVETDPRLGALANNGGFVQTISIPQGSSAKDIGLYAKRAGSGTNVVYFSENNTAWFTIDAKTGAKTPATPPNGAVDLSNTDARGYKITDSPDAGAYEFGATAP